jgi:hypothetical protein
VTTPAKSSGTKPILRSRSPLKPARLPELESSTTALPRSFSAASTSITPG